MEEPEAELDASLEAEIDLANTDKADTMNVDGADEANASAADVEAVAPAPDPRLPSKKDATLREFLGKMDDYAPIVRA